jgi:uncharacterized caspase-like protein
MTTRRTFIKTLAAVPPLLSFRPLWAANPAADPSRLALIIGNSRYHDAPLVNPANDAKAVGALFTQAGFSVDSRLNATRVEMMAAIERFGAAVKRAETKLVVFYYAGHGAQLDWRNYLLPVDAVVQKQEDMKQRCVDLSLLLGQFSAAKDKTFVVILDACRNNPFGNAYRPEQKGLSQFDAPVGSLLAFATSPGNVASDGEGQNGLYTENLVRELGKRGTRIEDALKRVRLNVRLASHGEQIPWETTSLEGDIFIFNEGQKKLSETELEQLVEADVSEWARIKSSKKVDDWVSYLRTFPNGRFAEIAQMRLARLLAEDEKLAAEKRQREEQQRLEQERIEGERIRFAEEQRLAAERKQLEEQQRQETRRREEEQKRLSEQKRLDQEHMERERARLAKVQLLAAERKQLEEQQQQEQRRREEEQQRLEARRQQEQQRLDRERQRIAEAERLAAERQQLEQQRQAAEQKRIAQEKQAQAAAVKPAQLQAPSPATAASSAPGPAASQSPRTATAAAAGTPALDIQAGVSVPALIAPSANPFSAGRYPLGRIFTVGDTATVRQTDILTGVEERTYSPRVTRVDYDEDRVEFNNGNAITDLMGNFIKNGQITFDSPVQFIPAEFQIGKKWTAAFRRTQSDKTSNAYYDLQIVKRETISVPAGSFDTFLIEGNGWNTTVNSRLEARLWLVPGVNFAIRREFVVRNQRGGFRQTERHELVALRQQVIGSL